MFGVVPGVGDACSRRSATSSRPRPPCSSCTASRTCTSTSRWCRACRITTTGRAVQRAGRRLRHPAHGRGRRATTPSPASPVLTQYITLFIRGMADGESGGPDKPAHDFPEDARGQQGRRVHGARRRRPDLPLPRRLGRPDADPRRRRASPRAVGLPGIIAHGLCTMAMCSQAVITTVADGDPTRLRRLAVRFAANVFPGNDVVTTVYEAGAADGGAGSTPSRPPARATSSIKHGLAEVGLSPRDGRPPAVRPGP